MVPRKRLELLHREATASKTVVSTNSTTWASHDAIWKHVVYPSRFTRGYGSQYFALLRLDRTSTNSTTWASHDERSKKTVTHTADTRVFLIFQRTSLYTCICNCLLLKKRNGGPGRDRTYEGVSQRIYSPPHLTTLEPTHGATNQTWTDDRRFTKPMLYQLSYGGVYGELYKKCWFCQKFL